MELRILLYTALGDCSTSPSAFLCGTPSSHSFVVFFSNWTSIPFGIYQILPSRTHCLSGRVELHLGPTDSAYLSAQKHQHDEPEPILSTQNLLKNCPSKSHFAFTMIHQFTWCNTGCINSTIPQSSLPNFLIALSYSSTPLCTSIRYTPQITHSVTALTREQ